MTERCFDYYCLLHQLNVRALKIFTGSLLGYFEGNTSGLSQQLLCQAVGRCEVQRPFALQVPEGAICPVVKQNGHYLWAGQTGSYVQGRVTSHTAVHTST